MFPQIVQLLCIGLIFLKLAVKNGLCISKHRATSSVSSVHLNSALGQRTSGCKSLSGELHVSVMLSKTPGMEHGRGRGVGPNLLLVLTEPLSNACELGACQMFLRPELNVAVGSLSVWRNLTDLAGDITSPDPSDK